MNKPTIYALFEGTRTELTPNLSIYSDGKKYVCGEWEEGRYRDPETKDILWGVHFRVFEAEGLTVYTWKQEILFPGEEIYCDKAPEMEDLPEEGDGWHYPEPEAELPHVPLKVSPVLKGQMKPQHVSELERLADDVEEEDVLTQSDYFVPSPTYSTKSKSTVSEDSEDSEDGEDIEEPEMKSLDSILFDAGITTEEDHLEDVPEEELDTKESFSEVTRKYKSSTKSPHSSGKTKAEIRAHAAANAKDAEGPKLSRTVLSDRLKANRTSMREARVEQIKANKEVVVESAARKHKIAVLESRLKVMEDKVESFQRAPEQSKSTDSPKEEPVQKSNSMGQTTRVSEPKVNVQPQKQLGLDAIMLIQSMDMETIIAIKKLEEVDIISNASLIVSILTLGREQKEAILSVATSMAA